MTFCTFYLSNLTHSLAFYVFKNIFFLSFFLKIYLFGIESVREYTHEQGEREREKQALP